MGCVIPLGTPHLGGPRVPRTPAFELTSADLRRAAHHCKAYRRARGISQMQLMLEINRAGTYCRLNDISNIERQVRDHSSRVVVAILALAMPAPKAAP